MINRITKEMKEIAKQEIEMVDSSTKCEFTQSFC